MTSMSMHCAPPCRDPLYHMYESPIFPRTVLSALRTSGVSQKNVEEGVAVIVQRLWEAPPFGPWVRGHMEHPLTPSLLQSPVLCLQTEGGLPQSPVKPLCP